MPSQGMFFKRVFDKLSKTCRLMDFALVGLQLLMFKVFGIIGISKIEFFNFSGTEKVTKTIKYAGFNCFDCFLDGDQCGYYSKDGKLFINFLEGHCATFT